MAWGSSSARRRAVRKCSSACVQFSPAPAAMPASVSSSRKSYGRKRAPVFIASSATGYSFAASAFSPAMANPSTAAKSTVQVPFVIRRPRRGKKLRVLIDRDSRMMPKRPVSPRPELRAAFSMGKSRELAEWLSGSGAALGPRRRIASAPRPSPMYALVSKMNAGAHPEKAPAASFFSASSKLSSASCQRPFQKCTTPRLM